MDEKEAVEEASAVIELIRDYRLNYPVFIDTEGAGGNGRADSLDAETRTLVCEAFCRTIENAGYTAGVYASRTGTTIICRQQDWKTIISGWQSIAVFRYIRDIIRPGSIPPREKWTASKVVWT